MIAIVFLLGLLAVTIFAAATGTETLPIAEILMLVGIFVLFFGSGVYIAAVLGILGVLIGFLFSDRPWWAFMGQTITFRFTLSLSPIIFRRLPVRTCAVW